jgi:hypothetical protein
MPSTTILEVSTVIFLATIFRTTFGFGEALIAVPLLALVIPVKVAAPLAVLASILIAGFAVVRDRKHIHTAGAYRLIFSTLFGIPLGLLLLKCGSETLVKGVLAFILIAFSTYSLFCRHKIHFHDDRYAWIFGFLAGISGGSYGVNGPPLAVYGSLRGWEPTQFRATLQGYFLPSSILGMCGYLASGLWTQRVNLLFFYSLPAITLGILCGRLLNRRVNARHFHKVLHFGILTIASILMFQILK